MTHEMWFALLGVYLVNTVYAMLSFTVQAAELEGAVRFTNSLRFGLAWPLVIFHATRLHGWLTWLGSVGGENR